MESKEDRTRQPLLCALFDNFNKITVLCDYVSNRVAAVVAMAPPARQFSQRRSSSQSSSKSPSPDPDLVRYLSEQKRPRSPDSEAFRKQRIAQAGVLNVKSRHQKEKEEAERKQLEEEKNAAKAYQEFVQDMQGDEDDGKERGSGFVHAGSSSSYTPNTRHIERGSVPFAPRAMLANDTLPTSSMSKPLRNVDYDEDSTLATRKREPPGKRKRAMEDFLGELQRNQAIREERLRSQVSEGNSISTLLAQEGSHSKPWDSPDPASTNVCILNLPASVNETTFGEYFSRYGDIASVKIMWSKSADLVAPSLRITKFPGSTGFINYMDKADAVRAYRETEDSLWMGSHLKVGWGKPLRKPPQPMFYKSKASEQVKYARESREQPIRKSMGDHHAQSSRSLGSRKHRRMRERSKSPLSSLQDAVVQNDGEEAGKRIAEMAVIVREYGRGYEEMMEKKELGNPLFDFLQRKGSIAYQYYRALVGDAIESVLPLHPFRDDGEASLYSSDSEEDSEWERLKSEEKTKVLGKAARRRLEAMLRGITMRRERIARVMLFAIEHASAAETVTDIIVESLLLPSTPLSRKLARLYVVSDILHNSSVSASNAWRYRSLFESKLDKVFLHWGDVSNSFNGRIKRESCKEMVRNTFNVWETWLVYENSKLNNWRESLESGSLTKGIKSGIDEQNPTTEADDIDGEEM